MRALIVVLILSAAAASQQALPPETAQDVRALVAELQRQNGLLRQQNELLKLQMPEPPKQHRKAIRVLLRVLPVIDHAGSISSITSQLGIVRQP